MRRGGLTKKGRGGRTGLREGSRASDEAAAPGRSRQGGLKATRMEGEGDGGRDGGGWGSRTRGRGSSPARDRLLARALERVDDGLEAGAALPGRGRRRGALLRGRQRLGRRRRRRSRLGGRLRLLLAPECGEASVDGRGRQGQWRLARAGRGWRGCRGGRARVGRRRAVREAEGVRAGLREGERTRGVSD